MSALADLIDTADILGHNVSYTRYTRQSVTLTTRDSVVPVADLRNDHQVAGHHVEIDSCEYRGEHHYIQVDAGDRLDVDPFIRHAHATLLDLAFKAVAW